MVTDCLCEWVDINQNFTFCGSAHEADADVAMLPAGMLMLWLYVTYASVCVYAAPASSAYALRSMWAESGESVAFR